MMAKTISTVLACVAAVAAIATAAQADPYRHHGRASAYGDSPAYWGVERRPRTYRDCCGWRWTRLDPRDASVRQLNPHLRARSDGRLLEEVGTPPPAPEPVVIWPDSAAPGLVIPPWALRMYGFKRGHHPMHAPNSAGARGHGGSGSGRRAR